MNTHLIKHALRISAGATDTYNPEGWNPKLRVTVMGPTPPDAELVWTQYRPDGSVWFEHTASLPELEDEQGHEASMQRWESGTDIDEDGTFRFTVRLVNELDGVDQLLHDGTFEVSRLDGGAFAVDHSSLLTTGLVALDVYDEDDAPKVRAVAFLGGSIDTYEVEAHLFHEGKRFAKASSVESGHDFTANDGRSLAREFIAEFDDVRGWNNLTAEGWGGDDWHMLDAAPGAYEIKFTRGGKVNRTMAFEVADGRIVQDELIEPDGAGRPTLWRRAEIVGSFEGDEMARVDAPRAYGDLETALIDYSSDDMYRYLKADVEAELSPYDDETAAAVEGVVDTAVRLLHTWESDFDPSIVRDDYDTRQFALQCEAVIDEVERFEPRFIALGGIADAHEVTDVDGSVTTLAAVAQRVIALRGAAHAFLQRRSGDNEAVLAPYRAMLRNDKLTIFEDHPAPDFRYYTTNKHVIETPEELAAADEWYFEGSNDIDATASVGGQQMSGSMSGWRVLGYRFDGDHTTVEETEQQGGGSSAPKSAFRIR